MTRLQEMCRYTITFEDIPATVDVDAAVERFSQHSHHLGGWPLTPPENNLSRYEHLPEVGTTSHVVRDVILNEDGGLTISFNFIGTHRGNALVDQYDTGKMKMVPVTDVEGINIHRFDFIIEED